jgi:hypothetical protein
MHYMTVGAPGLVDLLVLLSAHRDACKSGSGVLALCEEYVKAAATPTASESKEVCFSWTHIHHFLLLATPMYTWCLLMSFQSMFCTAPPSGYLASCRLAFALQCIAIQRTHSA